MAVIYKGPWRATTFAVVKQVHEDSVIKVYCVVPRNENTRHTQNTFALPTSIKRYVVNVTYIKTQLERVIPCEGFAFGSSIEGLGSKAAVGFSSFLATGCVFDAWAAVGFSSFLATGCVFDAWASFGFSSFLATDCVFDAWAAVGFSSFLATGCVFDAWASIGFSSFLATGCVFGSATLTG